MSAIFRQINTNTNNTHHHCLTWATSRQLNIEHNPADKATTMSEEFIGENSLEQLGAAAEQLGMDREFRNGDEGKKRSKAEAELEGDEKKPKKTRQTREFVIGVMLTRRIL